MFLLQLRETHEKEQEKAYQLKAQIIEVCGSLELLYFLTVIVIVPLSYLSGRRGWDGPSS